MKKILLIAVVIFVGVYCLKHCGDDNSGQNSGTPINGYVGTVESVNGNVLNLTSGLHARLLGVEPGRTDVEMFLRSQFLNKEVTLYADSHYNKQYIVTPNDTVDVYAVENGIKNFCVNRQVVREYPDTYHESEALDSTKWIGPTPIPIEKKNLALYMKQRTFLIQTPEGIGTGFFINEDGLAVTNWHVLKPGQEGSSIAVLYQDDPDDSQIYSDKKRNFKNIKFSSGMEELDITLVTVDLENGEKVPYFDIVKQRPNQGDPVATYGNPHGLTASFTKGSVSAFRKDPFNPDRDVDLIQYDMPTNGGNSGGPVCDKCGQIVAIHELGDKTMQNTNYGIDAMQLRMVLDKLQLKYGGK
jgi:S1-C subfamily serine protease